MFAMLSTGANAEIVALSDSHSQAIHGGCSTDPCPDTYMCAIHPAFGYVISVGHLNTYLYLGGSKPACFFHVYDEYDDSCENELYMETVAWIVECH